MTTMPILLLVLLFVLSFVIVMLVRRRAAPDVKEAAPPTLSRFLTGLAIFGAVWANGFLFARFWPNMSLVVEIGVAGALVILILLLYRRLVPRSSAGKKRRWWEVIEYAGGILLFVLDTHWRYHKPPATVSSGSGGHWLLIVPAVVGVIFLLIAPVIVLGWMIHKAYERGDHQGAMRLIDRFGCLIPRSLREDFRTMVLLYSGEPKQAESLIRSELENRKEAVLRNELNGTLGQALLDQGRYTEAEALFEQVIQGSPQRMGGYDGLAEIRILQGRPREAFELIEQAIRCEEARSRLVRRFEAYEQGHLWANRAWAEAALGWRAKAEQALERAFAAARKSKPELAGVHYRAGMLWNVLGSQVKAREHFRAARALDPEGRYGKKSRESELIAIS
jgi:tetratricopeptide (TPR) repeat protein